MNTQNERCEIIQIDHHFNPKEMATLLRLWLTDHVGCCSLSVFDEHMTYLKSDLPDEDADALIQSAVFETIRNDAIVTAISISLKCIEDGRHITECVKSLSDFQEGIQHALQQEKSKKDANSLSTYSDHHPSELTCEDDSETHQ